jgi:hypothetical protein
VDTASIHLAAAFGAFALSGFVVLLALPAVRLSCW